MFPGQIAWKTPKSSFRLSDQETYTAYTWNPGSTPEFNAVNLAHILSSILKIISATEIISATLNMLENIHELQ